MQKYIIYTRVSTEDQGKSGLGLEAQLQSCQRYAGDNVIATFTDIETGKARRGNSIVVRQQFDKAIQLAKKTGAMILVAKLDRLSRSVATIATIIEKGEFDFRVVDMPTANKITIHIMAAVAEQERDMISERTKAGLQVARAKGKKLGGPRLNKDGVNALALANQAKIAEADAHAAKVIEAIRPMRDTGLTMRQIAERLNSLGISTAKSGSWGPSAVKRVIDRMEGRI